MSKKIRDVALLGGQERDPDHNCNTRGLGVYRAKSIDFGFIFASHYQGFREHVSRYQQPGVAVVAIDFVRGQVDAVACVAARIGQPNALIIGRHSQADLFIDGDSSVSLRQMAVIVEPLSELGLPGRGVSYRVLDLRSNLGFQTEEGKILSGIRSDGPAFVAAGNYAFFFFVTGDPTDWPESAVQAWSFIPERVYLEERPRIPHGSTSYARVSSREKPRNIPMQRSITLVQGLRGPSRAERAMLIEDGEDKVAELTVVSHDAMQRMSIGERALQDGILLGRDERCVSASAFQHNALSRVHMLIADIGGTLYAIDVASTNGCYLDEAQQHPFRMHAIKAREPLSLAGVSTVMWKWAN